jgi:hypothetical protein
LPCPGHYLQLLGNSGRSPYHFAVCDYKILPQKAQKIEKTQKGKHTIIVFSHGGTENMEKNCCILRVLRGNWMELQT